MWQRRTAGKAKNNYMALCRKYLPTEQLQCSKSSSCPLFPVKRPKIACWDHLVFLYCLPESCLISVCLRCREWVGSRASLSLQLPLSLWPCSFVEVQHSFAYLVFLFIASFLPLITLNLLILYSPSDTWVSKRFISSIHMPAGIDSCVGFFFFL